ncbi:hypothetical protein AVEN_79181-1 [Araneus ventricosus]|uniref:Uncharacterized protein n=1 Tax=Araneus ventricosus TaxID=182803 RepID=A0A4Y2Q3L1_ARAVE|nr:hypothetical protein AVEN_79181-1 [Araneus ventricosus]
MNSKHAESSLRCVDFEILKLRRNGRFDPVLTKIHGWTSPNGGLLHSIDRSLKPRCLIPTLGISSTHLEYQLAKPWLEESLWWTAALYRAFLQLRCHIPTIGIFPTHLEYLLFKAWLVASLWWTVHIIERFQPRYLLRPSVFSITPITRPELL